MKNSNDTPVLRKVLGKRGAAIAVSAVMATSMIQPIVANATTLHNDKKKKDSEDSLKKINHSTPEWETHKIGDSVVQVSQAIPVAQKQDSVIFRVDYKATKLKDSDISFKVKSENTDTLFNDNMKTEVMKYNENEGGQALIKVKVTDPNSTTIKNDIVLNVKTKDGKNVKLPIKSAPYSFVALGEGSVNKEPVGLTFKDYSSPTTLNLNAGKTYFNVPFRFISNTGETLPVYNVYTTSNPEVSYANGFQPTASDATAKQVANTINQVKDSFSLNLVNTNLGGVTSSTTGLLNFAVGITNADNHMIIKPNVTVHYSVNGKEYSKPLPMNNINVNRQYSAMINPTQTFEPSSYKDSTNTLYITSNNNAEFGITNGIFCFNKTGNPLQWKESKIKTLQFKVTGLSDKFNLTVEEYPGLSYDASTKTITMKGEALKAYFNNTLPSVFNVVKQPGVKGGFCTFSLIPQTPKYLQDTLFDSNSLDSSPVNININFLQAKGTFMDNQVITLGPSSKAKDSIVQNIDFMSQVGEKVSGNTFNLSSFMFITGGFAIPAKDKDVLFYSVNNEQFTHPQQTCEELASGKISSGITKYTYDQLQQYIKENHKFPNINVVQKNTKDAKANNDVKGEVGVLPSNTGDASVNLNMYTVGTKVDKNISNSEFKDIFDLAKLSSDVVTDNGFFLSSNDTDASINGTLSGDLINPSDIQVNTQTTNRVRYGNQSTGVASMSYVQHNLQNTTISAVNDYEDTLKPVTVTTTVNIPRTLTQDNSIIFNLSGIPYKGGTLTVDYNNGSTKTIDLSKYEVEGQQGNFSVPLSAIGTNVTSISKLVAQVKPSYKVATPESVTAYLGVGSDFNSFNNNIIQSASSQGYANTTPVNVISDVDGVKYDVSNIIGYQSGVYGVSLNLDSTYLNNCNQNILEGNNKNEFNLQNVVRNAGNFPTSYYTIEHFPLNSSDTLPGSYNDIGKGPTKFTPEGFKDYTGDIYLIPDSETSTYNDLMNTQDTSNMSTLQNLVSTDKALVKYKPGMNIAKGYVGFIQSTGTINPGSAAKVTMTVKADGLVPNSESTTYTGFKYYDTLNQIGSVSNIKKIDVNWAVKKINKIINVSIVSNQTGKRINAGKVDINTPQGEVTFDLSKCSDNIATSQARTNFDFTQKLGTKQIVESPYSGPNNVNASDVDPYNIQYPTGIKYEITGEPEITNTVNSDGTQVENVVYRADKYVQVNTIQGYFLEYASGGQNCGPDFTGTSTVTEVNGFPDLGSKMQTEKQQILSAGSHWEKVGTTIKLTNPKINSNASLEGITAQTVNPTGNLSTFKYDNADGNVSFKVGDLPMYLGRSYKYMLGKLYVRAINVVDGKLVEIPYIPWWGTSSEGEQGTTSTKGYKEASEISMDELGGNMRQLLPSIHTEGVGVPASPYKFVKTVYEGSLDGNESVFKATVYVKRDTVQSKLHVTTDGMKFNPEATYVVTYKDGTVQTVKTDDIDTVLQDKAIASVKVTGLPVGYSLVSNEVQDSTKVVDGCNLTNYVDNIVLRYDAKAESLIVQSTSTGVPLGGVEYKVTYKDGTVQNTTSTDLNNVKVDNKPIQSIDVVKVPTGYKLKDDSLKVTGEVRGNTPWIISLGNYKFVPTSKLNANLTQTTKGGDQVGGVTYTVHYTDGTTQKVVSKENGTVPLDNGKIASSVEITTIPQGWRVDNSSVTQTPGKNTNTSNVNVELQKMKYVDVINNKMDKGVTELPSTIKYVITFENGTTKTIDADKATQVVSDSPVKSVKVLPSSLKDTGYSIVSSKEDSKVNQSSWVTTDTTTTVFHKINDQVNFRAVDQNGNLVKGVEADINSKDNKELVNDLTDAMGNKSIGFVKDGITPTLVVSSVPVGYKAVGPMTVKETTDSNDNVIYSVVQKLEKLSPSEVTTSVVTQDGKVLVPIAEYIGYDTETCNYKLPVIPKGYHIVKVTNNGNTFNPNKYNNVTYTKSTQNLVWVVEKDESPVKVTYVVNNKTVLSSKISEVKTGSPLGVKIEIPTGYKEVGITYNDKATTNSDVAKVLAVPSGNTIVVNLTKLHETVTTSFTDNGKVVTGGKIDIIGNSGKTVPNSTGELEYNSVKTGKVVTVPTGYRLDGAIVTSITTDKDGNQIAKIVQPIAKIVNTVAYKAIDQDGKVIANVKSDVMFDNGNVLHNLANSNGIDSINDNTVKSVTTEVGSVPKGYELNGKVELTKTVDKLGNTNWVAVQKLTKLAPSTVATSVVTEDGKVLVKPVVSDGYVGKDINYKVPQIPNGYHLINVTENGDSYKVPSKTEVIGKKDQINLVWIVAKNTQTYQVVCTSNVQGVSYGINTNEWNTTESATTNNGLTTEALQLKGATLSGTSAQAPVGYKQVGEPVLTTTTEGTFNKVTTYTYTYKFAPIPKVTVENVVELSNGKIMPQLGDSVSGYPDSTVKLAEPTIPTGYHLVKEPTNEPVLFPNHDVKCVWVIAKTETLVNAKYVDKTTGKEVTGGTFTINGKTESNAVLEGTPQVKVSTNKIPDGYRVVGKVVCTNSLNADKNTVVSAVQELVKINNKVTYKAIDQDGNVVDGVSATVDNNNKVLDKDLTNKEGVVAVGDNVVNEATTNSKSIPQGYKESGKAVITTSVDKDGDTIYNIVQHLIKLAPAKVTTEVVTTTGKVLDAQQAYTGFEGDTISYKVPKIPKGYELVKVTDNGKAYTPNTGLLHPNTGSVTGEAKTQNIVWVVQNKETTLTVEYKDGSKLVGTPTTTSIKTGSDLDKTTITIPNGYKEVGVVVNGVPAKDNKITGVASPNPNTIIVNIAKLHETVNVSAVCDGKLVDGVKVKTNDGDITTADKVVSNTYDYDSYKDLTSVAAPQGYKFDGVKTVKITKSVDKDGNQIVYIIVPLTKLAKTNVSTEVVSTTGEVLVPTKTVTGYEGSSDTAVVPTIPKGYEIIKVTDNGEVVKGLPKTFNKDNHSVVWTVQKVNSEVTVKVMDKTTNKEIGSPLTTGIKTGQELNKVTLPTVDSSKYRIVGYEVNGTPEASITGKAKATPNTIVINVEHNPNLTTEVVSTSGKVIVPSKTTTVEYNGEIGKLVPGVPTGYHLVGVEINGVLNKTLKDIPTNITNNETVKLIVAQNTYTDTVVVKTENGDVVVPSKSVTGITGTKTGIDDSKLVPAGYEVIKVTDNGKVTDLKDPAITSVQNDNTSIVVVVKKIPVTLTTEIVTDNGKVIVPSKTTKLNYGDSTHGLIPTVPTGYHIVKVTVNGNNSSLSVIPTTVTENDTVIITVAQNQYETKVQVVGQDGKDIGTPIIKTGVTGTETGLTVNGLVPKGYEIVNITDNNKVTTTPNIAKIGNGYNNIIINVKKMPQVTTIVETNTGKVLVPSKTTVVKTGAELQPLVPAVPTGYHLDKVIVNGTSYNKVSDIPNKVTENDNVKVIVSQNTYTDKVTVKTESGEVIMPTKTTTGVSGTKTGLDENKLVPTGYQVVSVTDNNKQSNLSDPAIGSVQNGNSDVVVIVKKQQDKVTTVVKTETGEVVTPSKETTVTYGSPLEGLIPSCPTGYTPVKVVVNNKDYNNAKDIPNEVTSNTNVTVIVKKIIKSKITTSVVTEDGKVLVAPKEYTGEVGSKDNSVVPTIPSGYQLIRITNNNKLVNGLPATFDKDNQDVIWVVKKIVVDANVDVVVKTTDGKVLVPNSTTVAKIGSDLNNSYMPVIPKGYKIVNVTTDGVNTGLTPNGKVVEGTNKIVITVDKVIVKEPVTVVVKTTTGETLIATKTVEVVKGTKLTGSMIPTIPAGYTLKTITVNGQDETTGVNGTVNAPTNIVVVVDEIPTGAISVIVRDINGNVVVPSKTAKGLSGTKDSLSAPVIPTGYEIVSIKNNTIDVDGMPKEFTGKVQDVVYTVKKIATKVTTKVVTVGGEVLVPSTTTDVKTGTPIASEVPNTPNGYKIVSVNVNGHDYNSSNDVTGVTNGEDTNIVVTVVKNKPVIKDSTISVEVRTKDGDVLVAPKTYTGKIGSDSVASIPTIPAGYKVINITDNGKVVKGLPSKFTKDNQEVVYNVEKITKSVITTTVQTPDGKVLVPASTVSGEPNTETGLTTTVPNGYHLDKILVDGKEVKEVPSKFTDKNETVTIVVSKDKAVTPINKGENVTPNDKGDISHNNGVNVSPKVNNLTTGAENTQPVQPTNVVDDHSPKTGDASELPFAVGGIAAVLALVGVNIKRRKETTKKDK